MGEPAPRTPRRGRLYAIAWAVTVSIAFAIRVVLALEHPCCDQGDAPVYSRLAVNLLDYRAYSLDPHPPHSPTSIRMPGYPIFLATAYSVRRSATVARLLQVIVDTATCVMVALLAGHLAPGVRGRAVSLAALGMMAVCPVTAIYVATLLSETLYTFLLVATALAATMGLTSSGGRRLGAATAAGLLSGFATLVRPEGILLAVGVGVVFTLAVTPPSSRWFDRATTTRQAEGFRAGRVVACALGFGLAMAPWMVWTGLHALRPLPPPYMVLHDGSVTRGYVAWLRTWVNDDAWIGPLAWDLGYRAVSLADIPDHAFDSGEERAQIAVLLQRYNESAYAGGTRPTPFSRTLSAGDMARLIRPNLAPAGAPVTLWSLSRRDDAEFERLAKERIRRDPFRYYVRLPLQRLGAMWFDKRFEYYRGGGWPLSWWPGRWRKASRALVVVYTVLSVMGTYQVLRWSRGGVPCLAVVGVLLGSRLAFLSMLLVAPEPRLVAPAFPLAIAVGAAGAAPLGSWLRGFGWASRRARR